MAQCLQALGCLLYYLAYGKLAFMGEAKLQVLNGDFTLPPCPQRLQPMKDLIRLMLTVQPAERPDIDTVLGRLGNLATNLKVDTAPPAAAPQPGVSRPAAPTSTPQPSQGAPGPQPLSTNPHDLVSTPVSASGHVLPARRASSGSLKVGREGSGVPPRSSSPAVGMAPLSPQHSRQTGLWLPCPQLFCM
jgi:cyclin G-associated kinase